MNKLFLEDIEGLILFYKVFNIYNLYLFLYPNFQRFDLIF